MIRPAMCGTDAGRTIRPAMYGMATALMTPRRILNLI